MILMGTNKLPFLYDHWKKDPVYSYAPVANKISRDRFKEISRFLHFTDNSKYTHIQSTTGVRPVSTSITQTYLNSYNPHHQMSIDEAMIPFKGRSSLKQYIPNKHTKRGIKVWVRADAINGFVSAIKVYVGKQTGWSCCNWVRGKSGKIRQNIIVYNYCDNYFTSVNLFQDLLQRKIFACGFEQYLNSSGWQLVDKIYCPAKRLKVNYLPASICSHLSLLNINECRQDSLFGCCG